jgi:surface carbohydrate biosynthesis protein
VLIYDACGQELMLNFLRPWSPEVLHVRGERINFPVMLKSLFRCGKGSDAYIDCFILRVKPKLVITFIDNSVNYYSIKQRHRHVKTCFVQNGWRSYYLDAFEQLDGMNEEARAQLKVDYMMTMGETIANEYTRYVAGTGLAIGSVRNNLQSKVLQRDPSIIAFISQWREDGLWMDGAWYSQEIWVATIDRPILSFLVQYAARHKKRLMVIPRTRRTDADRSKELMHFNSLMSGDYEVLEPAETHSSYHAIDMAGVVVGVDSTMVYEAIARGARTAVFSIRGDVLGLRAYTYGWPGSFPDEGPFWTNRLSFEAFERIMENLFALTDAEWDAELVAQSYSKLMIYDPANSIFKEKLAEILGAHVTC